MSAASPNVVNSATTSVSTATTSPVISLPGSIVAGRLLVAWVRSAAAGAHGYPAGWNVLINDGTVDQQSLALKIADGSEGANITLSSASAKAAGLVYQISDFGKEIVFSGPTTGSSGAPDPPNVTFDGKVRNYLCMAFMGCEGEQTMPPTYPTNFTYAQTSEGSGIAGAVATNVRVACGCRQFAASTFNPVAYAISVTDDWTTATLMLFPSPGFPFRRKDSRIITLI